MVHVRDMESDYYEYDEQSYSLIGARSKRKYCLGDQFRVIIAAANTESREIDLVFEDLSGANRRPKRRHQKRRLN